MPGFVFISYSRTDADYVHRLAQFLREHGIDTWYDAALTTGRAFEQEIQDRIDVCAAFVVVLSRAAVGSKWVQRELSYADDHDRPILPLLRETCRLPLRLTNVQYDDVTRGGMPPAAFLDTVRDVVRDRPAGADHPGAAPPSAGPGSTGSDPTGSDSADRLVADIHAARFRTRRMAESYDMEEVDGFLDRLVGAVERGEDLSAEIPGARFSVRRFGEGYDMEVVDDFLDHVEARMRDLLA